MLLSNDCDEKFEDYELNLYNIKKGKSYRIKFKDKNKENRKKIIEDFLIEIDKKTKEPEFEDYVTAYNTYFSNGKE